MEGILPDALVIGPMRCGTTWLDRYLRQHTAVCLPRNVKETFFFDRRYRKGEAWYAAHFRHCEASGHLRVCEVGPSYFHSPEAPRRVAATLKDPTLVVIVRHPVERSYSHYLHLVHYGQTSLPIRAAVDEFPQIIEASRYSVQLKRWIGCHSRKNVHLLRFETLRSDSERFVERVAQAMNLPKMAVPEDLREGTNRAGVPRNRWAAKFGWKVADFLRGLRWHEMVEFAKEVGVKDLLFAKKENRSRPELDDEDRSWLRQCLKQEIELWPISESGH